jgi:putative transposase
MFISYKYRIYPTSKQIALIVHQFDHCRWLYNRALGDRIAAYKTMGKSISYKDQQNELPSLKADYPGLKQIHSQVLQNILRRLDGAFQHFFRRVKQGEKPGFPRFKGKDWFDSICYPQSGFKVIGNKVELSKIGDIKIKLHRPIQGVIKTCTLKRSGRQWHIIFSSEVIQQKEKKPIITATGFDLGLERFMTFSSGHYTENPRYLKRSEEKIKEIQSRYSRKKSRSAKRALSNLHRKIRNQRNDFHHQISRELVKRFDLICYEDLNIKKMIDSRYAKSIHDTGWGKFIEMVKYKAESAGSYTETVNPYHTSQTCSRCGTLVKKEIYQRWHDCPVCGLFLHWDHNAAINILKLGTNAVFQKLLQRAAG